MKYSILLALSLIILSGCASRTEVEKLRSDLQAANEKIAALQKENDEFKRETSHMKKEYDKLIDILKNIAVPAPTPAPK
jgi:outer membrane murein-binding lipoprotein Lpp